MHKHVQFNLVFMKLVYGFEGDSVCIEIELTDKLFIKLSAEFVIGGYASAKREKSNSYKINEQ